MHFTTILQNGDNYLHLADQEIEAYIICAHHSHCSSKSAMTQVGRAHGY